MTDVDLSRAPDAVATKWTCTHWRRILGFVTDLLVTDARVVEVDCKPLVVDALVILADCEAT